MTDTSDDEPEEQAEPLKSGAPGAPERRLLMWFFALMVASACGLLWLSFRSDCPPYVRIAMDFVIYLSTGGIVAYLAFRALFMYPFRFPELLAIVMVLSWAMKQTVDTLADLAAVGLISSYTEEPQKLGQIFQICLIVGSVLLVGTAFGLRTCFLLKLERAASRLIAVVAGTVALPAAAGVVAFPTLLIRELATGAVGDSALWFIFFWMLSIVATGINIANFIKGMTLTAQIDAQEKMP
jgi:hypothetical protein